MSGYVLDRFEDSYPEDEFPDITYWCCAKCNSEYIDPDDNPQALNQRNQSSLETKNHWLGQSPICTMCAIESGIPSIDEE